MPAELHELFWAQAENAAAMGSIENAARRGQAAVAAQAAYTQEASG
jgi:hypothetical protein